MIPRFCCKLARPIQHARLGNVLVLMASCLALMPAAITSAQITPLVARVPLGKSGLKIEIVNHWPESDRGQRPIRVRLSRQPAKPIAKDELYTVRLSAPTNWRRNEPSTVSGQLVIPAGQISAELELTYSSEIFYEQFGGQMLVMVEKGRGNERLDANDPLYRYLYRDPNQTDGVTWLHLTYEAAPPFQETFVHWDGMPAEARGDSRFNSGWGAVANATPNMSGAEAQKMFLREYVVSLQAATEWLEINPADLPESWVGLTSIDRMIVSWKDFQKLCKESPTDRANLENWVAAGGLLIVHNTVGDLAHGFEMQAVLTGVDADSGNGPNLKLVTSKPGYKPGTMHIVGGSFWHWDSNDFTGTPDEIPDNAIAMTLPYLKGQIIAIRDANGDQVPQRTWFNSPAPGTSKQPSIGSSGISGSPLEGVGKPPVVMFVTLIGLFLFAIGPVVLGLIRFKVSNQRLFFMVPVASAIVCSLILGYAAVMDYSTKLGRTATLTRLHPETGTAYTQTTSAYYNGRQPAYYAYDKEVVAYSSLRESDVLNFVQQDDQIRMSGSRITSRRVHKVFTHRAQSTAMKIVVREVPEEGIQVANRLGGQIQALLVRHEGNFYILRDLGDDQIGGLESVDGAQPVASLMFGSSAAKNESFGPSGGTEFLANCDAWEFRNLLNQRPGTLLDRDGEFIAIMTEDPLAAPVLAPVNYQHKIHFVYGAY